MNQLTNEQKAAFDAAAAPLMQFLADNCHPHCSVHVTSVHAELLEGQLMAVRLTPNKPDWTEDRPDIDRDTDTI